MPKKSSTTTPADAQPNETVEMDSQMSAVSTEVEELRNQVQSLEGNWRRALADYQNLLRRVENEKKDFIKMASANLIARLLPSLDIIDMAATHTKDVGVEMAAKQFRQALTEEGLVEISPVVGDDFDHHTAECTEVVPAENNQSDNTVAELVLKGYKLGDFVLRPARVKVYRTADKSGSTTS